MTRIRPTGYPAQLRYPLASTNDYYMPTNGAFASHYNPKINVCGQCHNHAGASWTNSAGPPHPSSQYNMLLGTIGAPEPPGGRHYQPGSHALLLTNQCVECHMQTTPYVSQAEPGDAGHTFTVDRYDLCLKCHRISQTAGAICPGSRVQSSSTVGVRFGLLGDEQGARRRCGPSTAANAWEYTAPGDCRPAAPVRMRPSRR